MQKYYQRLIFLTLCIVISNAEIIINAFKDTNPDHEDGLSTVYATHAELWVDVVGCEAPACECKVKIEGSGNAPQVVKFRKNQVNVGSVTFPNLIANTNYSFLLTCGEGKSPPSKILNIKTDYGVPQAPRNINASVAADHVNITWSPPSTPEDSYSYYEIIIDDQMVESNVPKTQTSYKFTKELKSGRHTLNMLTCYKSRNGTAILCSDKNDAKFSFDKVDPTTTTVSSTTTTSNTTTATTAKSSGVTSYSFSLPIILSFLYLLSEL